MLARVCVVLIGAGLLTGCASGGHSASLNSRLVKPGRPAVDLGGPAPAMGAGQAEHMKQARQSGGTPPAKTGSWGARLENTDPRLAAALLLQSMRPSAGHQLDVAQEYRRLGILDAAYDRASLALASEPHLAEAHEMRAKIWRDWNMPARGLTDAHRATYFEPGSGSAWNTLGTILERLGQLGAAQRAYEAAAQQEPSAAWPQSNLCHVELQAGRLNEARARCERALALQPDFAAAHNNLALVFAASGDLPRAQQEFLAAGDLAAAAYNLGIVYLAGEEYDAAANSFEAAIKARPAFGAAKARAHAARVRALTGRE